MRDVRFGYGVCAVVRLPSCWLVFWALHWVSDADRLFYFEKIRVFKAGLRYEYISME